jgi:opacity protein-like surface antigen
MNALKVGLLAGVAALGFASTAFAADAFIPIADPIYDSPLFSFEGAYFGGYLGAGFAGNPVDTYGVGGGYVGVNFMISESFLAGIELQGGVWGNQNDFGFDGHILGRAGVVVGDSVLIYGAGGIGVVGPTPVFTGGGGLEFAISEGLAVRAETLAVTDWGFNDYAVKTTLGLTWYFE